MFLVCASVISLATFYPAYNDLRDHQLPSTSQRGQLSGSLQSIDWLSESAHNQVMMIIKTQGVILQQSSTPAPVSPEGSVQQFQKLQTRV